MRQATNPRDMVLVLEDERYFLASADEASQVGNGARAWLEQHVPGQETADILFKIPIVDFSAGSGFTFEGPPGTYDNAEGWDCSSPGRPALWPQLALGQATTTTDMKGWLFTLGNYLYLARGRYVVKYEPDETEGATWSVAEIHDLGNGIVCAGRPAVFQSKAYVPRRSGPSGNLAVFHELTTVAATTVETQTIAISGTPTSGTYTITFDGKTTAALDFDATGEEVQAALRALAGLELVTVATTGTTPNFTHTVTMTGVGGSLGSASPPQMTSTNSMSGGTPAIAHDTTSAGAADTWTAGAGHEARCFTVWQNKLVLADGNFVRTCSTAPTTDANWAPSTDPGYEVGESGREITDLAVYNRFLMVGKVDGLWSFDENLNTNLETADLRDVVDDGNCVGMGYSQGYLLVPHKAGTIRWRPGAWQFVGPEQEGFLEGDKSTGWGRVAGIATYGRYAFIVQNNGYDGRATLSSLQPGERRNPLTPHTHQQEQGAYYEDAAILSTFTQPRPVLSPSTAANDSAVGTVEWQTTDAAEGDADQEYATAEVGTSQYLKLTGLGASIPADATILGVTVEVVRSVLGATVHTASVSLAGAGSLSAAGTV